MKKQILITSFLFLFSMFVFVSCTTTDLLSTVTNSLSQHQLHDMNTVDLILPTTDRSYLKYKLLQQQEFANNSTLIDRAIQEYGRFMLIILNQHKSVTQHHIQVVPSSLVDLVWHTHILHTKIYALMCKNVFGQFIHHVPSEAPKSKDQQLASIQQYQKTLDAYQSEFNEDAPDDIWPRPAQVQIECVPEDAYMCTGVIDDPPPCVGQL